MTGIRTLDRPCGLRRGEHVVWAVDAPGDLPSALEEFFAEGAARNERLVYVSESGDGEAAAASDVLRDLVRRERLRLQSVQDAYALAASGQTWAQVEYLAKELRQARREGFSGLRVWADVTALVSDRELRERLLDYETAVESFFRAHAVTGVCAVDVTATPDDWRALTARHGVRRNWPAACEFAVDLDGRVVRLIGAVDTATLDELSSALVTAERTTIGPLVLDLTDVTFLDVAGGRALAHFVTTLRGQGRRVSVDGVTGIRAEVLAAFDMAAGGSE